MNLNEEKKIVVQALLFGAFSFLGGLAVRKFIEGRDEKNNKVF